jgi:hypothetical protein
LTSVIPSTVCYRIYQNALGILFEPTHPPPLYHQHSLSSQTNI